MVLGAGSVDVTIQQHRIARKKRPARQGQKQELHRGPQNHLTMIADNGGELMTYHYQQLIGGAWQNASNGATWDVLNPATEETVRTVPFGNAQDCALAIEAAAKAFPAWSGKTAYERAAVLKKAADLIRERAADLARTTVLECGK